MLKKLFSGTLVLLALTTATCFADTLIRDPGTAGTRYATVKAVDRTNDVYTDAQFYGGSGVTTCVYVKSEGRPTKSGCVDNKATYKAVFMNIIPSIPHTHSYIDAIL